MSTASDQAPEAPGSSGRGADKITERRQLAAKLYQQGLTLKQIGEIVDRSEAVVMHDLEVLGIKRRKEWRRGRPRLHPAPRPRPCAYCGEVFTPQKSTQVGKFCSTICHNRANAEAQEHKRGEWRTCLHCGDRFWKYASQMKQLRSRGDFCSDTCWGKFRWWKSDGSSARALIEAQMERGHFGTAARREWLGRFAGRKAPSPGGQARGRPRHEPSRELVDQIEKMTARGDGRRTIAEKLNCSEYLVRQVQSARAT
jgi:hypothetical protein